MDLSARSSVAPALEAGTEQLHDRVRTALGRLLAEATPTGWDVVEGPGSTSGEDALELDIAVRPTAASGRRGLPVLGVDVEADGARPGANPRSRRRALAELGIDHYWCLDPLGAQLDVWVRSHEEYRHCETLTGEDWLDYGVGVVHVDLRRLLTS